MSFEKNLSSEKKISIESSIASNTEDAEYFYVNEEDDNIEGIDCKDCDIK